MITKVLDGIDPIEFILKVMYRISFPCWFSMDFHGFMLADNGELKFEFGSRWTGI